MTAVRTIGVPMDLGADRRGVDMGPSAIRYAGLASTLESIGHTCLDAGDLPVPHAGERDPEAEKPPGTAKYLGEVEAVCTRLAAGVEGALDAGERPLVLGGDHSIAVGTLAGAARDAEIGAVWFDAHADFNTPESSPSGNVHGMPLAAALGLGSFADTAWATVPGLRAENVALVGLRSVDDRERAAINASDVTAYTMSDIDERGVVAVVEEAIDVAARGADAIHASLDLDWLDPRRAPGVGTPVRGGVTYREAHSAMEVLAERDADSHLLRSLELVEVNPILDEHNETAELAVELAASALGRRVL
ncbi:arginase [Halobacteriales archaeon QS_4_69_34]|nr:MAG: arginase [Halobacteriales archaeon QS_4_69_34]